MTMTPPAPKPFPALATVVAVLVMAGAIAAAVLFGRMKHDHVPPKESAQQASTSAADLPSDSPEKDNQFLWRLLVQGLQIQRSNGAAVSDARHVCGRFSGGESKQQIIQDILPGSSGMSVDTATDFAQTAIDV